MNALETYREITKKLASLGIGSASKEAELLVRQGLNISLTRIYNDNPEVSEDQAAALRDMVSRRAGREPLQYILGSIDFLGLEITVGKGVLIPRPETELMAEQAIKAVSGQLSTVNRQPSTMLDLCTGSGCLALALAKAFPDAMVYGTDISD
ncbi:MAG: peptide chain release factor N(5)-glutamine methyltransferase, partial [Nitrospirota bacterium]|nr:peptide chain release factor N(5)-glutamine methyltransferase [Nitrospirota bacterium]